MSNKIKDILFTFLVCQVTSFGQIQSKHEAKILPIEWAKKMADSDQKRSPDPVFLDGTKYPKWNYTNGLVTLANQQLHDLLQN